MSTIHSMTSASQVVNTGFGRAQHSRRTTTEFVSHSHSILACATSGSANLQTDWAETRASISARLNPTLRRVEAWQDILWLPTFREFFPLVFRVRTMLS